MTSSKKVTKLKRRSFKSTENERFSLGIKQLTDDPWAQAAADMPTGSKGTGKVTKITDFGAFVEIAPGIEGMIHNTELRDETEAEDVVKEGDEIEFVVLSSDSEERRFSLSRKALKQN